MFMCLTAFKTSAQECFAQAMDRAHRIGQENPVLVLRLASANSVDGRILKRANSKLMLERLVIRKGAFIGQEEKKGAAGLSNEELMELLEDAIPLKDEPQSGVVSDKVRTDRIRFCIIKHFL